MSGIRKESGKTRRCTLPRLLRIVNLLAMASESAGDLQSTQVSEGLQGEQMKLCRPDMLTLNLYIS